MPPCHGLETTGGPMTGGRGDYTMQLLRYDEVPAHAAQGVIAAAQRDREMVKA